MKIHFSPFSSNARKVLMTARELGLAPELVLVNLAKGEQRKPEFLALNPNGKVPLLVDGDFALSESQAIMAYLADTTPGQTLYPPDPRARALVNQWMFWSANHFGPAISMINCERVVKKMIGQGPPDEEMVARGEALFHGFAKILDAHLADRIWLCGGALSLADISVGCPLMIAVPAALPLEPYAHLRAWFARVQERDSWRSTAG